MTPCESIVHLPARAPPGLAECNLAASAAETGADGNRTLGSDHFIEGGLRLRAREGVTRGE